MQIGSDLPEMYVIASVCTGWMANKREQVKEIIGVFVREIII